MNSKQKKALMAGSAMNQPIGSWKSSLSGMATLRRQAAEEAALKKSKRKMMMAQPTLGEAYHRGWMQKDKERGELYLTILNDLAEDIDIKGRTTRVMLAEVLGWVQKEHQLMVEHMTTIHDEMLLLSASSLTSAMKEGLFKRAHPPKATQAHDKVAERIVHEWLEKCDPAIAGHDVARLEEFVAKAVLSIQHEQQRITAVGGKAPVETAINPVQQPARPGSGLSGKDQNGQSVDADGQPKQCRPGQAVHERRDRKVPEAKRTRQGT